MAEGLQRGIERQDAKSAKAERQVKPRASPRHLLGVLTWRSWRLGVQLICKKTGG
jgi:hypothetical protein